MHERRRCEERVHPACSTCGFCRNVCLWLAQPPQRFNSGSAFLVQLPKCTTSCHVLWTLISEVLMRRQTSASVKNLHQSVNDILWTWSGNALLHFERGDTLHRWMVEELDHSPELPIILYCDAKVAPLRITNLWPFLRADKQQAKQMKAGDALMNCYLIQINTFKVIIHTKSTFWVIKCGCKKFVFCFFTKKWILSSG